MSLINKINNKKLLNKWLIYLFLAPKASTKPKAEKVTEDDSKKDNSSPGNEKTENEEKEKTSVKTEPCDSIKPWVIKYCLHLNCDVAFETPHHPFQRKIIPVFDHMYCKLLVSLYIWPNKINV